MTFDLFRVDRTEPLTPADWQGEGKGPESARFAEWQVRAEAYVPEPNTAEAVNVAIALGKPLLVTGEPGVGKSQLAYAIAWQLGLDEPFKFVAKSTSESRDLFYRYDALARFHAIEAARHIGWRLERSDDPPSEAERAALERPDEPLNFVEYAALGRAILCGHERETVLGLLAPPGPDVAVGAETGAKAPPERRRIFEHPGHPKRSVVLIDEIDKASADFCNDLLDEIDSLRFSVPEVTDRQTPRMDADMRPIVLITSNRERELPPAFLRRCVYANIPYPARAEGDEVPAHAYTIENILSRRIGRDIAWSELARDVVRVAMQMQQSGQFTKEPGTAEMIDLIEVLATGEDGVAADPAQGLDQKDGRFLEMALRVLVKTPADLEKARRMRPFLRDAPDRAVP